MTQAFDYVNGSNAADLNPDDAGAYDGTDAEGYDDDGDASAYDGTDAEGIFDDIVNFVTPTKAVARAAFKNPKLQQAFTHATQAGIHDLSKKAGEALSSITNNPIWDIVKTGASFIPGIGTAVSAGMASAAAIGRGESLADIGLAAAEGALPGGPAIKAALHVAVGAVQGHSLSDIALKELRTQIGDMGGDLAKGAYDAGVAIMRNMSPSEVDNIRRNQTPAARKSFDAALAAHQSQQAGWDALGKLTPEQQKQLVGWTALSKLTPDQQRQLSAMAKPRAAVKIHQVKQTTRPANPIRPFPNLPAPANRVAAHMIANPAVRAASVAKIANLVPNVDVRDTRKAIAAFLTRFNTTKELDWRDVGELDTIDSAGRRHDIDVPEDLGEWPGETGAMHVLTLPRVGVSRSLLHSLYRNGDHNIKKAILAHGLLAHVARNTGELDGSTWTIRSGDNPWKVTQSLTGDGNRWKEIAKVNPNMPVINNGTALKGWFPGRTFQVPPSWIAPVLPLPAASPAPSVTPVATARPGGPPFRSPSEYPNGYPSSVYVVRAGDIGEKVAARITGDKSRWTELLKTNPKLADAKYGIALYTGKQIVLPPLWVAATPSPSVILQTTPIPAPIGSDPMSLPPVPDATPHMPPEAGPQPSVMPPQPSPVRTPTTTAVATMPAQPAVIASPEQLGVVQTMLASFYRSHVDASYAVTGAPFGSSAEDFAGVWNARTQSAVAGFQKWWNGQGKTPLHTDGLPDDATVKALVTQTNADNPTATPAVASKPTTPPATSATSSSAPKKSGGDNIGALMLLAAPFLLG